MARQFPWGKRLRDARGYRSHDEVCSATHYSFDLGTRPLKSRIDPLRGDDPPDRGERTVSTSRKAEKSAAMRGANPRPTSPRMHAR